MRFPGLLPRADDHGDSPPSPSGRWVRRQVGGRPRVPGVSRARWASGLAVWDAQGTQGAVGAQACRQSPLPECTHYVLPKS
jgi:hypothetical protein